jgi:hypothetical protein
VDCADPGQFMADHDSVEFDPKAAGEAGGLAKIFLEHSSTTEEVKSCLKDLRVLNKGDFKLLLKWRLALREFVRELRGAAGGEGQSGAEGGEGEGEEGGAGGEEGEGEGGGGPRGAFGESEADIEAELAGRREEARLKARREKKKVRAAAAKLRERKALGMDHNSFEVPEDEDVFSLKTIQDRSAPTHTHSQSQSHSHIPAIAIAASPATDTDPATGTPQVT